MDYRPLIIDSFAGGGGASTGIELALNRSPDVAINHSASALALHAANHPETLHLDSNIWDVEPRTVTQGRKVGLLWASPDCKHFSKAKGGAPRDRNIRDLAWVVVKWAEEAKPDVIILENVEEFVTWGPLGEDGEPIKELAGITFELWVKRLRSAGYKVQWRELRACDYGAPTVRKRFFLIARRDGRPIVWPRPTHGAPDSKEVRQGRLKPWRTAAECIDWTLPCPSIFETSGQIMEKHGVRAIRPLAKNTLARVARGMRRYVLDAQQPFLVNVMHGGRVEPAQEPMRTVTCANRGERMAVQPFVVGVGGRMSQTLERGMGQPLQTLTAKADSCVAVPFVTRFNTGATGSAMVEPLPTVVAGSWIKKPGGAAPLGVISPYLLSLKGSDRRDGAATDPHPTVLAGGNHSAVVAPVLVQTGYGERPGQAPRALDLSAPLGTIVAGGAKHAVVSGFLAQHNTNAPSHDLRKPLSTIVGKGCTQTPVAAWLAKYYGTEQDPRISSPLDTVTTKARFGTMAAELAAPPFGPEHEGKARAVAQFMRDHDAWDEREYVTLEVDGQSFVVVDIGMRMLTPRELFRAQGFPEDYAIEGVWREDDMGEWAFQPFPKDVQISCCGNSVSPPIAEALVAANCGHLAEAPVEREAAHG